MLLEELRFRRNEILELASRYGAENVRIFGSVARGEEGPGSDVDVLVSLPRGYDLFAQRIPLMLELEDLVGRKIELVPEHELNAHMKAAILTEAVHI